MKLKKTPHFARFTSLLFLEQYVLREIFSDGATIVDDNVQVPVAPALATEPLTAKQVRLSQQIRLLRLLNCGRPRFGYKAARRYSLFSRPMYVEGLLNC